MDESEKYIFKVITLGDANSGKTCLCSRLCDTIADKAYIPTIGVEFSSVNLIFDNKNIKLQLWDTAGQECFAPIVKSYYRNIVGIFFVIDLTSEKSVKNIDYWLKQFYENSSEDCDTVILALGNKIDLDKRVISYEKISEIFKKRDIDYMEISAMKNENVKEAREHIIKKILSTFDIDNHPGIKLQNLKKKLEQDLNVKNRNTCSYFESDNIHCCPVS